MIGPCCENIGKPGQSALSTALVSRRSGAERAHHSSAERLKRKAHILIPPHEHGSTETDERSCGVRAASKAAILLTKQSLRKIYSFCDITAVTN